MNEKVIRKCKQISDDIKEINKILDNFDRDKAEQIIKKHTLTDETVAVINSPLSPNFIPFNQAPDYMVKDNLIIIRQVLLDNLAKEQNAKEQNNG